MDIVKELKELTQNKAKLKGYEIELTCLETKIQENIEETKEEVIEGLSLRKSLETTISTNQIESKLEKIALNYSKELSREVTKEEVRRNRIAQIKSIIFYLKMKIECIEKVLLGCLDKKEKYVIHQKIIDNLKWSEVHYAYNNEYKREKVEIDALHKIKQEALKKIEKTMQDMEACILWRCE